MKNKFTVLLAVFISLSLQLIASIASAEAPAVEEASQKPAVWYFWTNQTGKGSYSPENGLNVVKITDPGPNRWSVGISAPGFNIEKGKKYHVVFEAKAVPPVEISSQVYLNSEPWTSYSNESVFKLSGRMQKFSYTFTMQQDSDPKAGLQFMFGGQKKSTITYDKVAVTCLGKDESPAAVNVLHAVNGDRIYGRNVWYFWTNETGKGTYTSENELNTVKITEPGPYMWSAGITEPGYNIESGNKYMVEFEAKAVPPLDISSQAYYNSTPWTTYSKAHTFKLSGKMQKYSYSFTMLAKSDPVAGIQFMFGGQKKSTVTYDKVAVTCLGKDETVIVFPEGLQDKKAGKDINDCTVFVFGQTNLMEESQQVFKVKPDINIRAFMKWGPSGKYASDYNFNNIHKYHYLDILLTGGITSAIQRQEFKDEEEFMDMATRDANGELVSWSGFLGADMYRGALANPKYRAYLIDTCKIQIDGGADGIHFDEPNSAYMGGPAKNWSNNEGFDDYSISDFNKYLMEKYPDYKVADWKSKFKMTDDNIIKRDAAANDLDRNFNYRKYLQKNSWTGTKWGVNTVLESANPLAKEWGKQAGNREYQDGSFTATYLKKYFKEIFDTVRQYGMEKHGKKIYFTTNGIAPCVDFNSLGIYIPNPDSPPPDWKGLDYVPIVKGRLNGSVSEMDNYKTMYDRSRKTSGDVPLVLFLDFPNEVVNAYYKLPLEQKMDFWRIYAAEAYAAGCYYAFHLSTVMDGEPTAEESGVLDFFTEYAKYYKSNSEFYHNNAYAENSVKITDKDISFNLMKQEKYNRLALHLINHHYEGKIMPQQDVRAEIAMKEKPKNVYMISPDFEGKKPVDFTLTDGSLSLKIAELKYYDIVVMEF